MADPSGGLEIVRVGYGHPDAMLLIAEVQAEYVIRYGGPDDTPLDPLMFAMQMETAHAHYIAGRYAEAVTWAEKAFREQPNLLPTVRLLAAANAMFGRLEEARKAIAHGRHLDPDLRISNLKDRVGPWHPEDFARYAEALRMAGLPE